MLLGELSVNWNSFIIANSTVRSLKFCESEALKLPNTVRTRIEETCARTL